MEERESNQHPTDGDGSIPQAILPPLTLEGGNGKPHSREAKGDGCAEPRDKNADNHPSSTRRKWKKWKEMFASANPDRQIELGIAFFVMIITAAQLVLTILNYFGTQEATKKFTDAAGTIESAATALSQKIPGIKSDADEFSSSAGGINTKVGNAVDKLQDQVLELQRQLAIQKEAFVITHTSMAVRYIDLQDFPLKGKPTRFDVEVQNNGPQSGFIEQYDIASAYRSDQPCTDPGKPLPLNRPTGVFAGGRNDDIARLPISNPPNFVSLDYFKTHPLYVWGKIYYGVAEGSDVTATLTLCKRYTYERMMACGLPLTQSVAAKNPAACQKLTEDCTMQIDTPECKRN